MSSLQAVARSLGIIKDHVRGHGGSAPCLGWTLLGTGSLVSFYGDDKPPFRPKYNNILCPESM
jgi:hypothetical protein